MAASVAKGNNNPPLGPVVEGGPAIPPPRNTKLTGRYVTVETMTAEHVASLFPHVSGAENASLWTYMMGGPFDDISEFKRKFYGPFANNNNNNTMLYAIIPKEKEKPMGCASFIRFDVHHRTAEVGSVLFSRALQRTRAATEAMYLLARHAFEDLRIRRYEWKCDALNAPSRRAARRLGFAFEGVFRKHLVVKGRSRDTAWFAMVEDDWEGSIKGAFEKWLDPANFDERGVQRRSLESFREGDR
ncbi:acyl-CoA N-acyltransferase [Xylariaceae sp. FL0594]|nr:acyl-CoA N-acyltransferase [Xylariaceae sp. FL0594]